MVVAAKLECIIKCDSRPIWALLAIMSLDNDIAARSAVENVLPRTADQHVVTRPTQQSVVSWAANEDVAPSPPSAVS